MKITLTDRSIKALKPAAKGKRYDVHDALVPGLAVRVTDTGYRSFVLVTRVAGAKNPTRRALARVGALALSEARQKAREWIAQIEAGADPKVELERQKASQIDCRFETVAEEFIRRAVLAGRKGHEVARDFRKEFVTPWRGRSVADIGPQDIVKIIDAAVDRGAPYQAHNLLGYARRFFDWAIARASYGLEHSPCDRLKPKKLIGPKLPRKRVLNNEELRLIWNCAGELGYPYGPLIRLLMLTGQRKSDVADVIAAEFDFVDRLWIIPPERMKSDVPHVVPLTAPMISIIETLPRQKGFLFSTTDGEKAVNGFSKMKLKIDGNIGFSGWVFHDLRRTMRTGLSALPVEEHVRELVIGHAKRGLNRVYDQFAYVDEKRRALELWNGRLMGIVETPPAGVVRLQAAS